MKRTKEQILQKIAVLFFENGYERTSVRDIGKALDMSNSGLYYYFKDKQEILFDIIDDFMEKVLAQLHDNLDLIQGPEERLLFIIQSHIRFFVKYPAQTKVVIYEGHSLKSEYAEKQAVHQREYIRIVKRELQKIIEDRGSTIDLNVATFSLMGTLNWIVQWFNPDGRVSSEALAKEIFSFFMQGLSRNS